MSNRNQDKKTEKKTLIMEPAPRSNANNGAISPILKLVFAWSIFLAALILFVVFLLADSRKMHEEQKETDTAEATTEGAIIAPMQVDAYPDLHAFVETYLQAIVSCDADSLKAMVSEPSAFDNLDALKARAEHIKAYSNLKCYTKDGPTPSSYVLFAVTNTQLANITTAPRDFMTLYIVKTEDGYRIQNGEFTPEVKNYIDAVKKDSDIQKIMQDISTYNKQALENDADLRAFYEMLEQ